MMNEETYFEYLKNYKNNNYPKAPVTGEEYAQTWLDFVKKDVNDLIRKGSFEIEFCPLGSYDSLHNLTEDKKIPDFYLKKFFMYKTLLNEKGYDILVLSYPMNKGITLELIAEKRNDKPI